MRPWSKWNFKRSHACCTQILCNALATDENFFCHELVWCLFQDKKKPWKKNKCKLEWSFNHLAITPRLSMKSLFFASRESYYAWKTHEASTLDENYNWMRRIEVNRHLPLADEDSNVLACILFVIFSPYSLYCDTGQVAAKWLVEACNGAVCMHFQEGKHSLIIKDQMLLRCQRSVIVQLMFYGIDLERDFHIIFSKKKKKRKQGSFLEVKWSVVEGTYCMLAVVEHA